MNRKLIRPNLGEVKDRMSQDNKKKKLHPSTDTHAENYYYLKQMNKKTNLAIVLSDGEMVEGNLEWYDRNCLKLNRDKLPNLLIYKRAIKYIYKTEELETTTISQKPPAKRTASPRRKTPSTEK
jgi:host factor-I protein